MRPVFDLEKLGHLLRDFYEITHIRITVFDEHFTELAAYPENLSPVCRLVRETDAGLAACRLCDHEACTHASGRDDAYVYRCHAGLTEAIMPIRINETPAGYLLFGQVMCYDDLGKCAKAIEKCCARFGIADGRIERACAESTLLPEAYIHAASHILRAVASYSVIEKMASLEADRLAEQLDGWIDAHYTQDISAQILCEKFGIGKTQLYAISKQLYGCGIMNHVRKKRIERAKQMLAQRPELTVGEIAFDCGYNDYNYFISVFSHIVGQSPNRYRRNIK